MYILQCHEFYGPDLVLHVTKILYISYTITFSLKMAFIVEKCRW